jgi:hypothetical protein
VAAAQEYLVYGRTSNSQSVFWTTTEPFFTDTGEAGTAGKPGNGTKWSVKNIFELKNGQDVLVENNVFENLWVADQPGYPIVLTPRNQNGRAPWTVVQRVMFRNNIVRHTAGGVNILSSDNNAPSQLTNHITIANNLFEDLTGGTWGSSRVFLIGGDAAFASDPATGADSVTIDHNTIISTQSATYYLQGRTASTPSTPRVTRPLTNLTITNNISLHNSFGLFGDRLSIGIAALPYLPDGTFCGNILAGGTGKQYPSTSKPAGFGCSNALPTVNEFPSLFVDFAAGDYRLKPAGTYHDVGPDIDRLTTETALALSGDIRLRPGMPPVRIVPATVPNGMFNVPYAQIMSCTPGFGPCAWEVLDDSMPAGLAFDLVSGVISGTPTEPTAGLLTLRAYDTTWAFNDAIAILHITIDPPVLTITMPDVPAAMVAQPFELAPSVSGALGSLTWKITSGTLPAGIDLDALTGAIAGTPTMWGTTSAVVQVEDEDRWGLNRTAVDTVTITVVPRPVQILTTALPDGIQRSPYQSQLAATGGTRQYTWSVVGGAVPPGLQVTANGLVFGEPQTYGRFAFSVQLTDVWPGPDYTATGAVTLVIAPPPLIITTATLASGDVWKMYRETLQFDGGTGNTSWSVVSGRLPDGLALSPTDGVISGKPMAAGTFSFTVQASDAGWSGNVTTRSFSVRIRPLEKKTTD